MTQLDKVNKYYFRGKENQIHVIDNTSMQLPDKGMVCLLGPSGCGKTTLLNAIGGLDKVDAGTIVVDGERITRVSSSKVDSIRNAKIGYIFQNFNLLEDKTVYENVAIALRMIGITDEAKVRDRVRYCLEEVGIYQYRRKLASALSGGQRQRVAIARAIVKNPKIIIADEPTGNLDSSNTLEIMNIIKAISKDRLVILVTHERNIAEFYSDYIAEMSDGKIVKAYDNDSSRFLDYQLENKIYLKDMPVHRSFKDKDLNVKMYSEDERQADIKLVIKGSNIYINTGGKLNVIDESSNVELIDDHYKAMDETYFENNNFDYEAYLPEEYNTKYTRIFSLKDSIRNGWNNLKSFKKIKKVLLLGFVFAAMFAFLAVSNVLGIFDVQPKDYMTTHPNYITVANPKKSEEIYRLVGNIKEAKYMAPGETKVSVTMPLDELYQTSRAEEILNVSLAYSRILNEEDLICGKRPTKDNQVVLDKSVVDCFLTGEAGKSVGITRYRQLIGRKLEIPNLKSYVICGITGTDAPVMYVRSNAFMSILANAKPQINTDAVDLAREDVSDMVVPVIDMSIPGNKLKLTEGALPAAKYETVVSDAHKGQYEIGSEMEDVKVGNNKLKVVGFYSGDKIKEDNYYVNSETVLANCIAKNKTFTVYAENPDQMLAMLEKAGLSAKINAKRDKQAYINKMKNSLRTSLIVAGILLLISLIEMFLMLRSSFMSRIKEVGTLRAIGLKKNDIYRMFAGEIIVITTLTAIPGIALMYYIMMNVVKITDYLEGLYMVTPLIALLAFVLVMAFNLLAGLIPVFRTMRKTPAEILARTDI